MRIHISTLAVACLSPKTMDRSRPVCCKTISGISINICLGKAHIVRLHYGPWEWRGRYLCSSFLHTQTIQPEKKHPSSVPCANPPPPLHPSLSSSAASPLSITTCVLCNADGARRCLNPLCLYLTHTHTHMQPRELGFFFFFFCKNLQAGADNIQS